MSTLPAYLHIGLRDVIRYCLSPVILGVRAPVAARTRTAELGQESWRSGQELREGLPVAQALPGPLAMSVGIYVSYLRGGFWASSP